MCGGGWGVVMYDVTPRLTHRSRAPLFSPSMCHCRCSGESATHVPRPRLSRPLSCEIRLTTRSRKLTSLIASIPNYSLNSEQCHLTITSVCNCHIIHSSVYELCHKGISEQDHLYCYKKFLLIYRYENKA